ERHRARAREREELPAGHVDARVGPPLGGGDGDETAAAADAARPPDVRGAVAAQVARTPRPRATRRRHVGRLDAVPASRLTAQGARRGALLVVEPDRAHLGHGDADLLHGVLAVEGLELDPAAADRHEAAMDAASVLVLQRVGAGEAGSEDEDGE